MAVRHVTGSARIISILNGLGHCISHSAVLEYDTDLAQMQLNSIDCLPVGIVSNIFATFVWDNIEFCEETVTGHGTTHSSTNGIIVQSKMHSDLDLSSVYLKSGRKSKKMKIDPPVNDIPNYFIGQQCNPKVPEITTCDKKKLRN
ncbi:hypothetical protein JTE90_006638 [Oedothorax gibbosus]|uniref:Uncharacterized protein n=1 Tax=Oedothorax gibbosus TaxID=931172 RepID=A0AAV6U7A4_9ARAC|nr:hypothetical protein JTE90_006638 [Oedothorax gibbosus]